MFSQLKRRAKLAFYAGRKYECPLCNYRTRKFHRSRLTYPVLQQQDVIGAGPRACGCYRCGSTDRERLIYVHLRERMNIFADRELRILHFAPEKNLSLTLSRAGFAEYVCGDLFTEGYTYPEYVRHMNVLDIPFADGSFDVVICNHLLEHIPDDRAAMREIHRVLKPGGRALLQVPLALKLAETYEDPTITTAEDRGRAYGQFDHVRLYGRDYGDRLAGVGFSVERHDTARHYPQHGLNPRETLYVGVRT